MSSVEIPSFQESSQHPWALPMPTPVAMTMVEILQRAVVLYHALTLADNLLVQSVEPMTKWLNMDIKFNEELEEGLGASE